MALLKLTEKYFEKRLEAACKLALSDKAHIGEQNPHAMTRGADYYRRYEYDEPKHR